MARAAAEKAAAASSAEEGRRASDSRSSIKLQSGVNSSGVHAEANRSKEEEDFVGRNCGLCRPRIMLKSGSTPSRNAFRKKKSEQRRH